MLVAVPRQSKFGTPPPEATTMNWREHIWIDAERMHGTSCLRDTRTRHIMEATLPPVLAGSPRAQV